MPGDLGAALLFFAVFLVMLYAATGRAWHVAAGAALFLAGAVVCYALFAHVRLRVDVWLDPWSDPLGRSYQIAQALYALGSGGVLGAGLGHGYPLYVPAAHTDFPFVVLAEEGGLPASLGLILVCALLAARGLALALRATDPFHRLLCAGLTTVLGVQAAIILGGNLKLIPLTGVTLPFVSYGGSSLLANFLILGVLLRVSHVEALGGADAGAATAAFRATAPALGAAAGAAVPMEPQLRRVGTLLLATFGVLALAAVYWQAWRGPALAAAPGNPRLIEEAKRAHRGRILDRGGNALAVTRDGQRQHAPLAPALAHVTGYTSARYGNTGVEGAYDALLSGRRGEPLPIALRRALTGAPRRGADVRLTVDAGLQEAANRALGDARGAVVVLDVRTGEVLALVSKPAFQPGQVEPAWEQLSTDEGKPLYNRATQGLYVPGSTFKVVTAAAALDAGLVQPGTPVSDPTGETVIEGFRITNAQRAPRPTFEFERAFAWSSNVVFAQTGVQLGEAKLREYAGRFGIGTQLPFELETSPTSISRTKPMPNVLVASTAFGQGELLVSPLQMALAAAAVARGGEVPRPYIVAEAQAPDGKVVHRGRPAALGRAVSPEAAAALRGMMALSVREGFGGRATVPGVPVAGKTGTAQSVPGKPDHAWFIGFAPVEQPRVAVAVLMEFSGWGSEQAAPVAGQVLEHALKVAP